MTPATSARIAALPLLALVSVACALPTEPTGAEAAPPEPADATVVAESAEVQAESEAPSDSADLTDEADSESRPAVMIRHATRPYSMPLIVVDGVETDATLADIRSFDVEAIELVRGAAAAAEYGTRARNGVVLITTKSAPSRPTLEESVSGMSPPKTKLWPTDSSPLTWSIT